MHRTVRLLALSASFVLLLVGSAFGQATTGSIRGEVVDQAQSPLAGVHITLVSEALQGDRPFDTLEDGRFRFFALPPGNYEMQIAKEGFKTILRKNVQISIGRTVTLHLVMEIPELGETVEVIDRRPLIDTETSGNSMSLDADFLKNLPSARSFQDVVQFLPGVTGGANPNINGGTAQQNRYYLDGASTTDPVLGTFSMNFNFDAIQDLEVITAGYDARYNQGLGGTINIVTKSGGNNFEGNFSGYIQSTALGESGDQFVQSTRPDSTSVDLNASLGGPIVRDRLWFYIAYQYHHSYSKPNTLTTIGRDFGRYPQVARVWDSHFILGKITAQPFARNKFTLTVRADPTTIDNYGATASDAVYRTAEAETWLQQGGVSGTLSHELQIGGRAVLTTQVIYQYSRVDTTPMAWKNCQQWSSIGLCQDRDLNVPAIYGSGSSDRGLDHGLGGRYQISRRNNLQIKSDLEVGIDRLLGSHTLQVGVEVNPIWHDSTQGFSGNELIVQSPKDTNNDGVISPEEINDLAGYENAYRYIVVPQIAARTPGVLVHGYLQDRWVPTRGLTINAGLRFTYANLQNNVGDSIIDSKSLSWGAGVAWDPFRDGKTRISVNYGSLSASGLLETSSWIDQNTFNSEFYNWDATQRRWSEDSTRAQLPTSSITHPDMIPTRTHEIFASVNREIARDMSAEVSFLWRRQVHLWEDDEVNVLWNGAGTDTVGSRNGNGGSIARLRTPEDSYRTYWSLTLRVRKQLSDNFTLEGSYVYSRLEANASGRYSSLDGTTDSTSNVTDRLGSSADYNNPTQRWNERGLAENDLPHVLKLIGTYDNPGAWKISEKFSMGYSVGGTLNFQAGLPLNRKQFNEYNRNYANYVFRRGAGERLPALLNLDLRGSLAFKVAGTQFDVIVQVNNVVNSLQALRADERALDSKGKPIEDPAFRGGAVYAQTISTQRPRSFEFGVRFTF